MINQASSAASPEPLNTNFTTIGHSNRTVETVVEMLRRAEVRLVVDVRAFPRSRSNPVFNLETFPADLAGFQIDYRHVPDLGGRRAKQAEIDEAVNGFWRVRGFHNYADYALSDEFRAAFAELIELGRERRLAIMCSEAVWWRCHRRIITDYLLAAGHSVCHLMGPGSAQEAVLNEGAKPVGEGRIVYSSQP